ncbi:ABC transporter substrate-binding protein [Meridianimarinicoccus sp. RP-17]|uniref:ABC transporter substrate-binding protein n=1 Tax=Meridianimarinicoccus zhengii TaxID=2056810 RepID=UPI000DAF0817|nr:ABC transporter substrate-binding protein [Phycocomes zhengii]
MFHRALGALALAAGLLAGLATAPAGAQTSIDFALDWKFEGPAAPYFAAIDNGHFAAEGLEVTVTAGQGSLDAIPKVATGAYPLGFADINSLVKFLDQNPGAPIIAIMMTYDKPPFAVVGRRSLGVEAPKDLEGRILGAPPPDGAWAQFAPFASANDLDMSKITVEPVGFPTREPMLAEGQVDAVTGFNFSSYLNLVRLGVPEDDISTILMADHGLDLYGNAIIVNTDFAAENPDAVRGFVAAVGQGWKDAIADPEAAVAQLLERNPAGDAALETRRLQLALEANVVTPYVLENGMGGIDPDRMARALEQIKETYEFQNEPDAALYFTDAYLPEGGVALN